MSDMNLTPLYIKRKHTASDITFGSKDETGIHLKKITYLPRRDHFFSKGLVLNFRTGGTAFVIKKFKKPIQINDSYALGLLLTAGHCVCDPNKLTPDSSRFQLFLDKSSICEAIFLRSFMHDYSEPMRSSTNMNCFVYSGDLALLLLTSYDKKLQIRSIDIITH